MKKVLSVILCFSIIFTSTFYSFASSGRGNVLAQGVTTLTDVSMLYDDRAQGLYTTDDVRYMIALTLYGQKWPKDVKSRITMNGIGWQPIVAGTPNSKRPFGIPAEYSGHSLYFLSTIKPSASLPNSVLRNVSPFLNQTFSKLVSVFTSGIVTDLDVDIAELLRNYFTLDIATCESMLSSYVGEYSVWWCPDLNEVLVGWTYDQARPAGHNYKRVKLASSNTGNDLSKSNGSVDNSLNIENNNHYYTDASTYVTNNQNGDSWNVQEYIDGDYVEQALYDYSDNSFHLADGSVYSGGDLYYSPSDYTYIYDTTNKTFEITQNQQFTYINYYMPGTTHINGSYKMYYELPDGRNSSELTASEINGSTSLYCDVINYVPYSTDPYQQALFHFDGNIDDSANPVELNEFTGSFDVNLKDPYIITQPNVYENLSNFYSFVTGDVRWYLYLTTGSYTFNLNYQATTANYEDITFCDYSGNVLFHLPNVIASQGQNYSFTLNLPAGNYYLRAYHGVSNTRPVVVSQLKVTYSYYSTYSEVDLSNYTFSYINSDYTRSGNTFTCIPYSGMYQYSSVSITDLITNLNHKSYTILSQFNTYSSEFNNIILNAFIPSNDGTSRNIGSRNGLYQYSGYFDSSKSVEFRFSSYSSITSLKKFSFTIRLFIADDNPSQINSSSFTFTSGASYQFINTESDFNGALYLDGLSHSFYISGTNNWFRGNDWTLSYRYYQELSSSSAINYLNIGLGSDRFYLEYNGSQFLTLNCGSYHTTLNVNIPVGTWNTITFVRSGSNIIMFLNGIKLGQVTSTLFSSTSGSIITWNLHSDSLVKYFDEIMFETQALYTAHHIPRLQPWDSGIALVVPPNAPENSIAIQSAIQVNNWRIGGVRPNLPQYGDVYIYLVDNLPKNAQQWNGYMWIEVGYKVFNNEHWYSGENYKLPVYGDFPDLPDVVYIPDASEVSETNGILNNLLNNLANLVFKLISGILDLFIELVKTVVQFLGSILGAIGNLFSVLFESLTGFDLGLDLPDDFVPLPLAIYQNIPAPVQSIMSLTLVLIVFLGIFRWF